jgi:hypothetical protein
MGLYPPSSIATTLANLQAVGIVVVQLDEGWFIKSYQQIAGPYDTPEAALEASIGWLAESGTKQVGGSAISHHD